MDRLQIMLGPVIHELNMFFKISTAKTPANKKCFDEINHGCIDSVGFGVQTRTERGGTVWAQSLHAEHTVQYLGAA